MFLRKMLLGVLLFCGGSLSAIQIDVEAIGQGNLVRITKGTQVMLVDAGSSEFRCIARRSKNTFSQKSVTFELSAPGVPVPYSFQHVQEPDSQSFGAASEETASPQRDRASLTSHSSGSESSESQQGTKRSAAEIDERTEEEPPHKRRKGPTSYQTSKMRDSYREETLQRIYNDILKANGRSDGPATLKTAVVTHPDEDHYNLFPLLFNTTNRKNFFIETLILSGFYEDYNEDFRTWIERAECPKENKKIGRVICTGMADGERRSKQEVLDALLEKRAQRQTNVASREASEAMVVDALTPPEFARPYCSVLADKTELERDIEKALSFSDEQGKSEILILSMNAGHAVDPETKNVRIANESSNVGSIVLRVMGEKASIVLAGDAERETWYHVLHVAHQCYKDLKSAYFLVSHHGSKEAGATNTQLFEKIFEPKCFVLSAGRQRQYHHPHQDTLRSLLAIKTLATAVPHDVSYFGPDEDGEICHRRTNCRKAIFSTLNHGGIGINLDNPETKITTSLNRVKRYEVSPPSPEHPQRFVANEGSVYVLKQEKTPAPPKKKGKALRGKKAKKAAEARRKIEADAHFQEAVQELIGYFNDRSINAYFWVKDPTVKHQPEIPHKLVPYGNILKNLSFKTTQHILVTPETFKFRWLEEEQEEVLQSTSLQAPSTQSSASSSVQTTHAPATRWRAKKGTKHS